MPGAPCTPPAKSTPTTPQEHPAKPQATTSSAKQNETTAHGTARSRQRQQRTPRPSPDLRVTRVQAQVPGSPAAGSLINHKQNTHTRAHANSQVHFVKNLQRLSAIPPHGIDDQRLYEDVTWRRTWCTWGGGGSAIARSRSTIARSSGGRGGAVARSRRSVHGLLRKHHNPKPPGSSTSSAMATCERHAIIGRRRSSNARQHHTKMSMQLHAHGAHMHGREGPHGSMVTGNRKKEPAPSRAQKKKKKKHGARKSPTAPPTSAVQQCTRPGREMRH